MTRAAIYARISSDRQGDGLGVARQVEDCERLAERRGWEVVRRYVDDDVSAYSGRTRPQYRQLLEDLTAGLVDAVVVWHLDRLHRQPKELEEFFEVFAAAKVSKMASVTGDLDLATHDGQFTARILGAVARKESDDKSRRIRRKALENAQAGKIGGGGTRPYGYERDRRTVNEGEAAVVRESVRRLLAGESIRSVCADLSARGVPTVTGSSWKTQTLRRIVSSARIGGQREHHGTILAEAEWPGIVAPDDAARLRALFADPTRRTNRTPRRYLLAGLLRCKLCGEALVSRPRDDGKRRYICAKGPNFTGCGHLAVVADELEALVVEAVLFRLDSPELHRAVDAPDAQGEPWQQEVDATNEQLDELSAAYAARQITMREWLAARGPIEARLTAAKKRLARLDRSAVLDGHVGNGAALRSAWSGLHLSRQRAIVAALIDHLVIGPGRRGFNRFDSSRAEPVWRG